MAVRRATVEHPYGTLKAWMGATHFTMKTRERVGTEMSLQVLAYNIKRVLKIMGRSASGGRDERVTSVILCSRQYSRPQGLLGDQRSIWATRLGL